MIHDALADAEVDPASFAFTPFPIDDLKQLPYFLPTAITCFTTICDSWNRRKIDLLSRAGYPVIVVREREPPQFRGGIIRDLLKRDDDAWTTMVPASVVRHLRALKIRDRLRFLEPASAAVHRIES
jgi:hypothetical protein